MRLFVNMAWRENEQNKRNAQQKKWFLNSEICRKCYLPRKVKSEFYTIEDRKIEIKITPKDHKLRKLI